ncbi:hypothetical protein [Mycobacterium sp. MMS18-G62]
MTTAMFGGMFVLALAIVFPHAFAPLVKFLGFKGARDDAAVPGIVLAALFGIFVVQGVKRVFSRGLRLTSEGLELDTYKLAWTEVDDFEKAGRFHIRVKYWPGHELSRREKLSVVLGKMGVYARPAYIDTGYDTNGRKLVDVLRRYRLTHGR